MIALKDEALQVELARLPGWALEGGKLERTWSFEDFRGAMAFVNEVAEMAEAAGHHPDIDIRYNKVKLGLVTHDAGGITSRDVEMAKQLGSVSRKL